MLKTLGLQSLFYVLAPSVLGTSFAIMVGMVYAFLPFAISPIYNSLDNQDRTLAEASLDLGARVFTAFSLVLVQSATSLVIVKYMGDGKINLITSIIESYFFKGSDFGMGNQKLAAKKASAENKITKLEAMLLKAKEGKKKSYQSAINKLEKKIYQFDKRIEIIKEQKEDDQLKIAALKQVLETKKHALQEHDSKEAQIQIKKIQIEINILIEGREKSQLRMTLEKLSHTKANIENKLRSTYEEITKLKPLIYKEVSLTENINNQINNLELNNNLSGSQINELENLKNTQKQHLEFKTNKLHVLATKVSDKLEEIKQLVINKQNKLFNTGNENPKPKT
ncbi:hypothetical protein FQR65_LT16664 [Abscondita terminalis]|nr:hypothetical protein FQR65_LT16664 [Abscondita terminalis]